VVEGDTAWVSMLSRTGHWKQAVYDGCLLGVNLKTGQLVEPAVEGLLFPHSVQMEDGGFLVLDSLTGRVVSSTEGPLTSLGGFVRGMAVEQDLLYVGQSRNRRLDAATRHMDTVSMDSGVYAVHRASRVQRFIKLPQMCDVYDILNLESHEERHDG